MATELALKNIALSKYDAAVQHLPRRPRWLGSDSGLRTWAGRTVEGAYRKANGKWYNKDMFPGREFDDLDAFRAAKKQRAAQRYVD